MTSLRIHAMGFIVAAFGLGGCVPVPYPVVKTTQPAARMTSLMIKVRLSKGQMSL